MARITVYNEEDARYWDVDATLDMAVINGTNSGVFSYYIRLNTSERDPDGGDIPDQVIEDFPVVSNVSREVENGLELMIQHQHGEFLSSSSSGVWRQESTQALYSTSGPKSSQSSVSSASSASSTSTSSATYSSDSDSSESTEEQGE